MWLALAEAPSLRLPAHLVFECLAYASGFALYRAARRRRGDFLSGEARSVLLVAIVAGAALGSKILHHAAHPGALAEAWSDPAHLLGGKTIVGALLGGWIAVELAKRRLGIRRATGDVYALPLALAIAVGRVGCLLSGVADGTHGVPTTLPWGVDGGDGIARHPTALYEIVFLALLSLLLARPPRLLAGEGRVFRFFLGSYLAFRTVVDAWKPAERLFGLSAIQWAALAGLTWIAVRWVAGPRTAGAAAAQARQSSPMRAGG